MELYGTRRTQPALRRQPVGTRFDACYPKPARLPFRRGCPWQRENLGALLTGGVSHNHMRSQRGAFHFLGSVPGTSGVQFVKPLWLSLVPGTHCARVLKFTLNLKCTHPKEPLFFLNGLNHSYYAGVMTSCVT